MITDSFDNESKAIINPTINENAPIVDACIITFSHVIEEFVIHTYKCEQIGTFHFATGNTSVYCIDYAGKKFAFYKTYVGAPACVGTVEDSLALIKTDHYLVFGGAGCLNKEIAHGKVMVPTEAYRDEGTSYHYVPAADYITIKNANTVASFMNENGIPYVMGKTWTTDSFYRETVHNFEKHKADGCISVEMECAGLQAMCDFRGLNFYTFFTSGDLLDAPEWDERRKDGQVKGTQHDAGHFDIALELACYIVDQSGSNSTDPLSCEKENIGLNDKYIGIDGCKGGWIAAIQDSKGLRVEKFESIDSLLDLHKDFKQILIDMAIGFPSSKSDVRPDSFARTILKGRSETIFNVPSRQAIYQDTKEHIRSANIEVLGKSLPEQSIAIIPKMREIDEFLDTHNEYKNILKESHPEVCFTRLNGSVVMTKKAKTDGYHERLEILKRYLPELTDEFIMEYKHKFHCNKDDIVDALVLMVTAKLEAQGKCEVIPAQVMKDAKGLNMQMIIPR